MQGKINQNYTGEIQDYPKCGVSITFSESKSKPIYEVGVQWAVNNCH